MKKWTCAKHNHTFWENGSSKGIRSSSRMQPQHRRSKLFLSSKMTVLMLLTRLQMRSLAALHRILKGDGPVVTNPFIQMEKNCENIFTRNHKSSINASKFSAISCMKPMFTSALWLNSSTSGTQKKKVQDYTHLRKWHICCPGGCHVLSQQVVLNLNCWCH